MGAKPSIKIETPEFIEADWQYQSQTQSNPQYGLYRTLSNRKTGDMIDEFNISWANQQEYSYYLKSFNWRYNQPNVVNTRYIVQKSKHEFCAQTYVVRVYIEHVIVRLSEINDIPFPQNLYVLMQALQGYSKIFEHSKYFVIEENQICVDGMGNVKIWVNSDLSINYPSSDQYDSDKNAGEQKMVERLVHLIAQNTDRQSEPQLTLLEYFEEKKGFKGKKFQEARVLVLNYAKLNETQIPDKFEAVLNLAVDEQQTVQQNQYVEQQFSGQPLYNRQTVEETPQWQTRAYTSQRFQSEGYRSVAHPIAVIRPPVPIQHQVQPIYGGPFHPYSPPPQKTSSVSFGHRSFGSTNHVMYVGHHVQQSPAPIQYIPNYTRIQYPRVVNQPQHIIYPPQQIQNYPPMHPIHAQQQSSNKFLVEAKQEIPKVLEKSRRERPEQLLINKTESKSKLNDLDSPVDIRVSPQTVGEQIRVTLYNDLQNFLQPTVDHQLYDMRQISLQNIEQLPQKSLIPKQNKQIEIQQRAKVYHNSNYHQNIEFIEVDNLVAKSLPIKTGYPASTNAPLLNEFSQNDRSAYSHIHNKEYIDSFGLNTSGQFKLKNSLHQKLKESDQSRRKGTKGSAIVKPVNKPAAKYYYSLSDELQIDPDIAADMQRYLAT